MTQGKEVAIYQSNMSITELRQLAADFAKSGYFQDAKEAVQAVVKIQAGIELGFGPVYSMTKIYIVKGKIAVSAEAMGAMVKRSGRYDYKVVKLSDAECELQFTDNGKPVYNSRFTMADAKRADLIKIDSGWLKYPRAMLMSKALSQGARIVCPHVISGVYTMEDFGISVNQENVIESTATDVTSSPPVDSPTEGKLEAPAIDNTNALSELVSEPQRRKIFASANGMGISAQDLRAIIKRRFGKYYSKDLTKVEASEIIEKVEAGFILDDKGEWAK